MSSESFDVFLSHNSQDKPRVEALGRALKERGLKVWLDKWELQPGLPWQAALENIVTVCRAATVCFGSSNVGPWEDVEMQALLNRFVKEKKNGHIVPIIPVLLPGAPENVKLPLFLEAYTWVDLRRGLTPDSLELLRWGITGEKPQDTALEVEPSKGTPEPLRRDILGEKPREDAPTVCLAKVTPDLRKSRETVARYLASARLNVLPAKSYSPDAAKFLPALEADLAQSNVFVQILGATSSDRTDELPEGEERAQLQRAKQSGKLILQWRDRSVDLETIDDPQHRELVSGADVVCNDLTEFAKMVAERAQRIYEGGRPTAAAGDQQWLALIKADKPDQVVADELSQTLSGASVNNRVTNSSKTMMDWLRDVPYDALLIVCGSCSEEWLEQRGDELMAVELNLKDKAPVRAYCINADGVHLPYRSKGVLQVKPRDQASWQQLMVAIQKRSQRT